MAKNNFYAIAVGHITGIFEAKWKTLRNMQKITQELFMKGFQHYKKLRIGGKHTLKNFPLFTWLSLIQGLTKELVIPKKEEAGLW
jgi:hypothetical protein